MKSPLKNYLIAALILSAGIFLLAFTSSARADDSETACPAVYPCLDDGSVIKEFSEGVCGVAFKELCMRDHAALLSQELNSCQSLNKDLDGKYDRSLRVTKRLRRALREQTEASKR